MEVLHSLECCLKRVAKLHMKLVKVYMIHNLEAARKFYKILRCNINIWIQQTIFKFYDTFHAAWKAFHASFQIFRAIKI